MFVTLSNTKKFTCTVIQSFGTFSGPHVHLPTTFSSNKTKQCQIHQQILMDMYWIQSFVYKPPKSFLQILKSQPHSQDHFFFKTACLRNVSSAQGREKEITSRKRRMTSQEGGIPPLCVGLQLAFLLSLSAPPLTAITHHSSNVPAAPYLSCWSARACCSQRGKTTGESNLSSSSLSEIGLNPSPSTSATVSPLLGFIRCAWPSLEWGTLK